MANKEAYLALSSKKGTFSNYDGDGNENVKTAIDLLSKTTSLHVRHAFLHMYLPLLHDYDAKMPNFTFYGGRPKQATAKFCFNSLSKLKCPPPPFSPEINPRENCPTMDIFS